MSIRGPLNPQYFPPEGRRKTGHLCGGTNVPPRLSDGSVNPRFLEVVDPSRMYRSGMAIPNAARNAVSTTKLYEE